MPYRQGRTAVTRLSQLRSFTSSCELAGTVLSRVARLSPSLDIHKAASKKNLSDCGSAWKNWHTEPRQQIGTLSRSLLLLYPVAMICLRVAMAMWAGKDSPSVCLNSTPQDPQIAVLESSLTQIPHVIVAPAVITEEG